MKKNRKIEIAHDWLRNLKAVKKLSNDTLGDIIDYSNTGLGKALKVNSLKYEQIRLITIAYNLENDFEENFNSNESCFSELIQDYPKVELMGLHLKKYHEHYLKTDPTYEMFLDNIASIKAMKMIKDLYSKS